MPFTIVPKNDMLRDKSSKTFTKSMWWKIQNADERNHIN